MIEPKFFNIYYADLKYNNSSNKKDRPVILIEINSNKNYLECLKITDCKHKHNYDSYYEIVNWADAGLSKKSIIDLTDIFYISPTSLRRYVGRLNNNDLSALLNKLKDIKESKKKKEDEIKIMPNYDVTKGPIANGGLGDAPVVALEEDVDGIHLRDVLDKIKTIYVYNDINDFHYYESLDEDLPWEEDILSMSDEWLSNNISKTDLSNVTNLELLDRIAKIDKNKLTADQLNLLKKLYNKKIIISKEDVQDLIDKFRDCNRLILAQRPKNNSFIEKYDLSLNDCLNIIHNLKVSDYASSTRNYNLEHLGNNLIIFEPKNVRINNSNVDVNIYIKLDVDESIGSSVAAVSFHEAKYDNKLPYEEENVMEEKSSVFNTLVEGYTLTEEEQRDAIIEISDIRDYIIDKLLDCSLIDVGVGVEDDITINIKDDAIKYYAPTVSDEDINNLFGNGVTIKFNQYVDKGANYNDDTDDYEDVDTIEVECDLGDDFYTFYFYPHGTKEENEKELNELNSNYLELFTDKDVINTLQGVERDYGTPVIKDDIDEAFSPFEELKGHDTDEILKAIQGYCVMHDGISFARVVNTELVNGILKDVNEFNLGNGKKLVRHGNGFELVKDGKHIWTGTAASAAAEISHAYIGKDDTYAEEFINESETNIGYVVGNFIRDKDGDIVDFEDLSPWDRINKTTDLTDQRMFTDEDEAIEFAKNNPDVSVVLKVEYEYSEDHDIYTIWTLPEEAEVVWTKEDEVLTEEVKRLDAKKIAYDIEKVGVDNKIYPELDDYSNGPIGSAICSFFVSGDWKHDHRRFELLVDDYCKDNNLVVFNSSNEEVGESDDDSYRSVHTFYIIKKEDEEKFNGMRRAFNGEESLDENLEKWPEDIFEKGGAIIDDNTTLMISDEEMHDQLLALLGTEDKVKEFIADYNEFLADDDFGLFLNEDIGDEFIGKKVRIVNLSELSPADFGMDDHATEDEIADYKAMMEHEGEIATITNCIDQVENNSLEGYWDVKFEDGYEIPALSDYHMELVEDESLGEAYVIAITDYDPDQITYVGGDDAEHSANGEVNVRDAVKFASKEAAQKWIDEMNRAYDEDPNLSRLTYKIKKLDEAKLTEWEDNGYRQHVWVVIDEVDRDKVVNLLGEPEGEGDYDDGKYVLDYYFNNLDAARDFANKIPGDIEWDEEELDEDLLEEMAMLRKDAMDRCLDLGNQFVNHFDKIYNENNINTIKHHAQEMQNWLDQVNKIVLKPDNKPLSIDKKVDWFLTAGSDSSILFNDATEANVYDDFMNELIKNWDVRDSLVAVGLLNFEKATK